MKSRRRREKDKVQDGVYEAHRHRPWLVLLSPVPHPSHASVCEASTFTSHPSILIILAARCLFSPGLSRAGRTVGRGITIRSTDSA